MAGVVQQAADELDKLEDVPGDGECRARIHESTDPPSQGKLAAVNRMLAVYKTCQRRTTITNPGMLRAGNAIK